MRLLRAVDVEVHGVTPDVEFENVERDSEEYVTVYMSEGFYMILTHAEIKQLCAVIDKGEQHDTVQDHDVHRS